MNNVPSELKFLATHEWLSIDDEDIVTVGISDHAQALLGDLVFIELPEVGSAVYVGDTVCVVESVKAASDTYAPVSGEIVEINSALEDMPECINSDPYGEGWMYRMKIDNLAELDALLSAADYEGSIAET